MSHEVTVQKTIAFSSGREVKLMSLGHTLQEGTSAVTGINTEAFMQSAWTLVHSEYGRAHKSTGYAHGNLLRHTRSSDPKSHDTDTESVLTHGPARRLMS